MYHSGQFNAASELGTMRDKDRQELTEKWQVLGLSLIMLSETNKDFFDLFKQEFGYVWDDKGWIKRSQVPLTSHLARAYKRKNPEDKKPR